MPQMRERRRMTGLGGAVAAAWLALVATFAVARAAWGVPHPADLGSSPQAVLHGRLWLLLTSGLVIQGPALVQLLGTAVLVVVIVERFGGRLFWLVAAAGHLGATLIAYAGIGVLWLVHRRIVGGVATAPDDGISAVWAACVGAIGVAGLRGQLAHPRWVTGIAVGCLLTFVVLVPANGELSDVEHLLAFALGAGVAGVASA
jgi:hypothetical protein